MNKISKINKNNKSQILNTHTTNKYLIFNRDSAPSVARGNCLDRDQIGTRWDPMGWDPWEPKGIPWEGIPWEGEPLEARGIPREGTLGIPRDSTSSFFLEKLTFAWKSSKWNPTPSFSRKKLTFHGKIAFSWLGQPASPAQPSQPASQPSPAQPASQPAQPSPASQPSQPARQPLMFP
jgi:hypothetical protein